MLKNTQNFYRRYNIKKIEKMTSEECKAYLEQLNLISYDKNYSSQVINIMKQNKLEDIKKLYVDLLEDGKKLKKHWKNSLKVEGIGITRLSTYLSYLYSDDYIILNRCAYASLSSLGIYVVSNSKSYNRYIEICNTAEVIKEIMSNNGIENVDMLMVYDMLVYYACNLQKDNKNTKSRRNIKKYKIHKTDYILKAKINKEIGEKGEKLVIEYEKIELRKLGLLNYISKIEWVSKVDDSAGYDVKSYGLSGKNVVEKYIEVKSTAINFKKKFFLTRNEYEKLKENNKQYYIYRVLVAVKNMKPYIIKGVDFEKKCDMKVEQYSVQIK